MVAVTPASGRPIRFEQRQREVVPAALSQMMSQLEAIAAQVAS